MRGFFTKIHCQPGMLARTIPMRETWEKTTRAEALGPGTMMRNAGPMPGGTTRVDKPEAMVPGGGMQGR